VQEGKIVAALLILQIMLVGVDVIDSERLGEFVVQAETIGHNKTILMCMVLS
jgi:hypothetical protein